jgi:pimeloyl-ACP methyl ester carboxylesterase
MDPSGQIEPQEGFLETPDGKLHYLDWCGSGLHAHFLHANGFCAGAYSPFIEFLINDLHIIASDIRGHGGSDQLSMEPIRTWAVFAEDLKLLIENKMTQPVIGMGHSLGAVTTCIAAAKYPHLFSGIVLLDPVILPRRMHWLIGAARRLGLAGNIPQARGARRRRQNFRGKKEALKLFAAGRGVFKTWSKEFIHAYMECGLLEKDPETAVLKCDPELEAQIFESVPAGIWRYARKISCPVLAVRGELSDTFWADSAERLKRVMADYELVTIPDSGHFVPMEKPRDCAQAISNFITRKFGRTK